MWASLAICAHWTGLAAFVFVLRGLATGHLALCLVKVCLVEAYTTQIDNLVLPIFTATAVVLLWLS